MAFINVKYASTVRREWRIPIKCVGASSTWRYRKYIPMCEVVKGEGPSLLCRYTNQSGEMAVNIGHSYQTCVAQFCARIPSFSQCSSSSTISAIDTSGTVRTYNGSGWFYGINSLNAADDFVTGGSWRINSNIPISIVSFVTDTSSSGWGNPDNWADGYSPMSMHFNLKELAAGIYTTMQKECLCFIIANVFGLWNSASTVASNTFGLNFFNKYLQTNTASGGAACTISGDQNILIPGSGLVGGSGHLMNDVGVDTYDSHYTFTSNAEVFSFRTEERNRASSILDSLPVSFVAASDYKGTVWPRYPAIRISIIAKPD